MANREAYNTCMKPYITGSKPKEQRKLDFCVGAKMCSGKATNKEEAQKICLSAPPKEPTRRSKKNCATDMIKVAECLAPLIKDMELIDAPILSELLQKCACGKVSKAAKAMAEMKPEQIEALKTISQIKQEYGGNVL